VRASQPPCGLEGDDGTHAVTEEGERPVEVRLEGGGRAASTRGDNSEKGGS
jgi:hypothetical protein